MDNAEMLILYVDQTRESKAVEKSLIELGTSFRKVFSTAQYFDTPTLEGKFGTIAGFANIQRYLFSVG